MESPDEEIFSCPLVYIFLHTTFQVVYKKRTLISKRISISFAFLFSEQSYPPISSLQEEFDHWLSQMKRMPDEDKFVSQFTQMSSSSRSFLSKQDAHALWSRVARMPSKMELIERGKRADELIFTSKCKVWWSFGLISVPVLAASPLS